MIGIFDSGVGGLTVLKEIRKEMPLHDILYFGDTARTPYGNKSKDVIVKYALEDADFLIKKGAKLIIIACNTASALAYGALKEKYSNISIFEVITPAVESALSCTKNNRIGVIGTRATIDNGIYEKKLKEGFLSSRAKGNVAEGSHTHEISPLRLSFGRNDKELFVRSHPCPLFVPFIEEGWLDKPELKMVARRYLADVKRSGIDTLILGCTHYPIIKDIIQNRMGRRVRLVDSAKTVAERVKIFLENNNLQIEKNNRLQIFVSDKTSQCQKIANTILGNVLINSLDGE